MKKSSKNILVIAIIAAAAVAAWLIFGGKKKEQLLLETDTAARTEITNSVTATGTIEPVTTVDVGTQVSGIIDKLYVDYNDEVKAGQVIAEMDKVTLEAELKTSQSQLASAKTEYEYRQKEYNRIKALHDKELVSDSDYDTALYNYETARNSYNQAQSSMVKVKRNLGYATITSPIDGVVISRAVEEGQTVAAGFSTPTLFTIANDLTQMEVIADVDEADIGAVADSQRVEFTVDAYPDDVFEGKVKQVRLEATTESSVVTYEVVISAYNPDLKLKPGLTANVTIYTLEKPDALTIASKALKFNPDPELLRKMGYSVEESEEESSTGKKVWVIDDKKISERNVTVGASTTERTEITDGISEGEKVAVQLTVDDGIVSKSQSSSTERSPFMPKGPGDNKKK